MLISLQKLCTVQKPRKSWMRKKSFSILKRISHAQPATTGKTSIDLGNPVISTEFILGTSGINTTRPIMSMWTNCPGEFSVNIICSVDNPPPKVVQGYKFNIFYPDLIDKSKAPTYKIVKEPGNDETVLLHFSAGPPYEDVAFRIVNREWEFSHKRYASSPH